MSNVPEWVERSPSEIEDLVVELARKNNSPSEIGIILRDQYGIPRVNDVLDKSVLDILEENEYLPDIPEELMNLMEKAVSMRNHLDKYQKDIRTQRSLKSLESKIHRLIKYHKNEGKLPQDWRYDPERAALMVRG